MRMITRSEYSPSKPRALTFSWGIRRNSADAAWKQRFKVESLGAIILSLHPSPCVRPSEVFWLQIYSCIHKQVLCHRIWNFYGTSVGEEEPPPKKIPKRTAAWMVTWRLSSPVRSLNSSPCWSTSWRCGTHYCAQHVTPHLLVSNKRRLRPPSFSIFQLCSAACRAPN